MAFTFELSSRNPAALKGPVNNIEIPPEKYLMTPEECFREHLKSSLEQTNEGKKDIRKWGSASVAGVSSTAFNEHRKLVLGPDDIWSTIERGLSIHINENAEEFRHQFVDFKGKCLIDLRRDHFVKGDKNDWEGCFDEFSEKIGEHIKKKKDLIVGNFSTTTKLHRVSSEIILMDAMSKFFDYSVTTLCNIPIITLEGDVEDWENIRNRVRNFEEFGLSWWTEHLNPVLDHFIKTAKGEPDIDFWRGWYNEGGGSGGPFISGHVQKLYPYLGERKVKNTFQNLGQFGGVTLSDFPVGISKVPFVWDYWDTKFPMEFSGGIIGVKQREDGGVQAAFGWAVREASVSLDHFPIEKMEKDIIICDGEGDRGKLKKAECIQYGEGPRSLSDLIIEWEKKGVKEYHRRWEWEGFFVKDNFTREG